LTLVNLDDTVATVNQLQNYEDIALTVLCSALNFDFSAQRGRMEPVLEQALNQSRLNNPKGFKEAAAIVADFKELIDPIIGAYMDEPAEAVGQEEKLADEVNRITTWRLERNLVKGRLGNKWEIVREFNLSPAGGYGTSFKNFLLARTGTLLMNGAMEKLRKCRNCHKYIRHTGGRLPEFCSGLKCRNEYFNSKKLRDNRLLSRVQTLVWFAKKKDIELTDSEKNKISRFIGLDEFPALREQLRALTSVLEWGAPERKLTLIREKLPKAVCDRLETPRQKLAEEKNQENKQRRTKKTVAGKARKSRGGRHGQD